MTEPSRNIVLFSDGTGNSSGKLFRTNVWRTYQALDLKDPQDPPDPRQHAFYDDGVGTSSFKPLAMLGGAIGLGLSRNVKDLYAYLCRTYRPANAVEQGHPADKIYAFGFSRGAFTIRVLTGLVMNQGIVAYDGDEAKLQRDVAAAWRQYRQERYGTTGGLVEIFRGFRDGIIAARNFVMRYDSYSKVRKIGAPLKAGRAPREASIEIEFLGLWDTVDAYGLPIDELTRAVDRFFFPLSMPDHDLNPRIKRARHALSLDDERNTFHPRLWNEMPADVVRTGRQTQPTKVGLPWEDSSRITQVWFAGVHSNVGGGYPDDGLSHVSLTWMLRAAKDAGLRFEPSILAEYAALSDESGPIYDSRRGLASYYRYNPRRIESVLDKDRITVQTINVHESVFRRIRLGLDGYAPITLTPRFEIMKVNGEFVDGPTYLGKAGEDVLPGEAEHVWNGVWWRRVAYFWTLISSLTLASMPLWAPVGQGEACHSPFCFIAAPIRWAGVALPAFAAKWIDVFVANPGCFAILAVAVAGGVFVGTALSDVIFDRMRLAWYSLASMCPAGMTPKPIPQQGQVGRLLEGLRSTTFYHRAASLGSNVALTGFFVIAVCYLGVALASQVSLAVASSAGWVCGTDQTDTTIRAASFCNRAPGPDLVQGAVYRISLTITEAWEEEPPSFFTHSRSASQPGGISANPNGLLADKEPWYFPLGVPLRRQFADRWYQLMARVGTVGDDVYTLTWRSVQDCSPTTTAAIPGQVWVAELTSRSSGPLFLYVNDASLYPLVSPTYSPNKGAGTLKVERVRWQ